MQIAVSRLHFPITTLGPGRRIGLWFQGCSIKCPGCISVDTWASDTGLVPVSDVLDRAATFATQADGLTISGGEPFDQPEALTEVLTAWRELTNRSVLLFTGKEFEDIKAWLAVNPNLVDAVVAGPFRSELSQTFALRGSDNQSLHIITPQGEEFRSFDRPLDVRDRKLDVMFDVDGDAWFAGIPARGDVGRLCRALAAARHHAHPPDKHGIFAA